MRMRSKDVKAEVTVTLASRPRCFDQLCEDLEEINERVALIAAELSTEDTQRLSDLVNIIDRTLSNGAVGVGTKTGLVIIRTDDEVLEEVQDAGGFFTQWIQAVEASRPLLPDERETLVGMIGEITKRLFDLQEIFARWGEDGIASWRRLFVRIRSADPAVKDPARAKFEDLLKKLEYMIKELDRLRRKLTGGPMPRPKLNLEIFKALCAESGLGAEKQAYIANALGVSPDTLQRGLSGEGWADKSFDNVAEGFSRRLNRNINAEDLKVPPSDWGGLGPDGTGLTLHLEDGENELDINVDFDKPRTGDGEMDPIMERSAAGRIFGLDRTTRRTKTK